MHAYEWLDSVEPPPTRLIPGYLSFVDAVPPHTTIFTGLVRTSLERYRLMAESTWNMAFPAAVFGPDVVQNVAYDSQVTQPDEVTLPVPSSSLSTSAVSSSASSSPRPSSSAALPSSLHPKVTSPSHSSQTSARPTNVSRTSGKRKAAAPERRNKFIPLDSPLMPIELESWTTASRMIGQTFDNNQPERPGVSRNYVLPEPYLFAGHPDPGARQAMVKTYLKVREVLLYDVLTRGAHNCLKSPADWRRMMGLELHGQKSDKETRESRLRKKLRVDLQNVAANAPELCMVS